MGVLSAQWETSHKFTGTFTSAALHFHDLGAVVWQKSAIGTGASPLASIQSSNAKRDIIAQEYKTFDNAGTERYADSTGVEATSSGFPYAGDAQLDATDTPFFYLIRPSAGNNRVLTQLVHESDLLNEAKADAYIAANIPNWVG